MNRDLINNFLAGHKLMQFEHCSALVEDPRKYNKAEDVYAALADFNTREGWLCLTDRVAVIAQGEDFSGFSRSMPLSGEFAAGEKSLYLRQKDDGWITFVITKAEGGEHIMVRESFIAVERYGVGKLQYETFWWKGSHSGAYRPYVSRFTGFGRGGE
jgi:hypothetical protein